MFPERLCRVAEECVNSSPKKGEEERVRDEKGSCEHRREKAHNRNEGDWARRATHWVIQKKTAVNLNPFLLTGIKM